MFVLRRYRRGVRDGPDLSRIGVECGEFGV
jgi:hypothetical protein